MTIIDSNQFANGDAAGWTAASPLLTIEEAAHYLRLDVGRTIGQATNSVRYLVKTKQLDPTPIGEGNLFAVWSLNKCIRDKTGGGDS